MRNDKILAEMIDDRHRLRRRKRSLTSGHCLCYKQRTSRTVILCLSASLLLLSSVASSSSSSSSSSSTNNGPKSNAESKLLYKNPELQEGLSSQTSHSPRVEPLNELITADSIYPCLDTFDIVLLTRNTTEQSSTSGQSSRHYRNSRSLLRVYWATDDIVHSIQHAAERHSLSRRLFPLNRKRKHPPKHAHVIHRPSMLLEMRKLNYVREFVFENRRQKLLKIGCDLFETLENIHYCFVYVQIAEDGLVIYESLPHCVPTTLMVDEPSDVNYQNDHRGTMEGVDENDKSAGATTTTKHRRPDVMDINLEDVRAQILPPGPAYTVESSGTLHGSESETVVMKTIYRWLRARRAAAVRMRQNSSKFKKQLRQPKS